MKEPGSRVGRPDGTIGIIVRIAYLDGQSSCYVCDEREYRAGRTSNGWWYVPGQLVDLEILTVMRNLILEALYA